MRFLENVCVTDVNLYTYTLIFNTRSLQAIRVLRCNNCYVSRRTGQSSSPT